jgi:hypothetical protein
MAVERNPELDIEVVEMVALTMRGLKRNGFNDHDIRLKLRKMHDDSLVEAAFNFCQQEDAYAGDPGSHALKEPSNYYGWYAGPKRQGEFHWPHLKRTLIDKTSPWTEDMIKSLDDASTLVVSHLAPPDAKNPIKCKGLVLGYIQSGKTANFSATIAKAVDEGYKLIIVLAGMHNNLRKQTEIRLREELVNPSNGKTCTTLTTDDETGDFRRHQPIKATRTLGRKDGFTLAVIKKNSSVLRNFRAWLEDAESEVLKNCPTLIIDDESDQASVNTNKEDQDPTAINNHIRELVNLFKVVSYVGYTATPFANVFINGADEDDLYPRDFLIALEKPKTYYGPEELFGRDAVNGKKSTEGMPVIRPVPNKEAELIKSSIKDHDSVALVPSLVKALDSFLLGAGLRLCRGQWKNHICMLIHMTHLTGPQEELKETLDRYISDIRNKIEDGDEKLKSRIMALYENDFSVVTNGIIGPQKIDFDLLWKNLAKFAKQIEIIVDNSNSTARLTFDPELRDGDPLWGIIIGGNTLSRGLTLDGLTTSFFIRDSKTYDTLLQMGRWFGYRKGYADLTRIFVTDELRESFEHLASVEQEIRDEIAVMAANEERPYDVALRIRKHPSMLITAKNKMRSAVATTLTFSGTKIQTHQLNVTDTKILKRNRQSVEDLLKKIESSGRPTEPIKFKDLENCFLFRSVHHETILQFLDSVAISENNAKFDKKLIQEYILESVGHGRLTDWSVAVMSLKQGIPIKVGSLSIHPMNRTVKHEVSLDDGSVEATLRAISTPGEELIDLADRFGPGFVSTDNIIEPKDGIRKSDTEVRQESRPEDRALLMIYPLQSNLEMSSADFKASRQQIAASYPLHGKDQIFAFTLVFPKTSEEDGPREYLVNPLEREMKPKREKVEKEIYVSKEIIKAMKVLNIAQPHAHDVIFNGKNVENRSKPAKLRGTIAIYASKKLNRDRFDGSKVKEVDCAFGCIIGFADVVDCITKNELSAKTKKWFHGPYGYVLENIVALKKPIAVSPPQGAIIWWNLDGKELELCLEQIPQKIKKTMKPGQ